MKIRYLSDLHLEYNDLDFLELNDFFNFDVLVLAGDILEYRDVSARKKFFQFLTQIDKPIMFVCGNHEFYHSNIQKTLASLQRLQRSNPNFHLLNNSYVDINGVRFIGSTLWCDFSYVKDTSEYIYILSYANDFKNIYTGSFDSPINAYIVKRYAEEAKNYISHHLQTNGPNIVITHFGPSDRSKDIHYTTEQLASYYVSNCESIMHQNSEIAVWFHGHIHQTFDYFIHKTRILSNPRGRPVFDEHSNFQGYDNQHFDPLAYIEL